jgi:hypothetical protein
MRTSGKACTHLPERCLPAAVVVCFYPVKCDIDRKLLFCDMRHRPQFRDRAIDHFGNEFDPVIWHYGGY